MNLLIVDDEYYSAEGTKKKIAQKGPLFDEIFCAYNMTQALEYLAGHSVAIMILDIEMPGGSGLELLDHIRQQGLDTICIFLTAYAKFEAGDGRGSSQRGCKGGEPVSSAGECKAGDTAGKLLEGK